jgi:hypothetical protein
MSLEDLVKAIFVRDVDFVKLRPLPADEFDTIQGFFGRVVEVVDYDNLVIGLQQRKNSERANVPCATAVTLT